MLHPDEIQREFERLVALVDAPQLERMDEGLWTRVNEAEIWSAVGRLARLAYVNAMMAGTLKSAFEGLVWGLARMEIRTADATIPSVPVGSAIVSNRHAWDAAREEFQRSLASWPR